MREEIDFVITWVDGSDEAWKREKAKYNNQDGTDDGEERYRNWNTLKYWFRGVEKYAPWVRKIHFITWGHLPEWLDTDNPRLHIVRHEDYVPEEFLPTFNSNVLELYLHRIEGLAEHFVYFNDDMFLIGKVSAKDFFKCGKPCDMLAFQPVVANPSNPVMTRSLWNNTLILSRYFDKRSSVKKHPGDYFKIGYPPLYFLYNILEMTFPLYTGFYTIHGPSPFCRSTFEEVWEKEKKALTRASANRFRSESDITQYLFREWQKLSGNFRAENVERGFCYFDLALDNRKLISTIRRHKCRIICINDAAMDGDIEKAGEELREAFEQILPESSEFERIHQG